MSQFYHSIVYYCPGLGFFINEILNSDICKHTDILKIIFYDKAAPEHIFSAQVEQNTSSIIVCSSYLEQFLVNETKYLYAADGDFWFDKLDRGYCTLCIKHYLKKMAEICRHKVFNNE